MKKLLIFSLFIILFSSFVTADLTDDNVLYNKLDDNTDPEPDAISSTIGMDINGASFNNDGFINQGYEINFLESLSSNATYTFDSTWTISIWFRPIAATNDFIMRPQSGGFVDGIQVSINTNKVEFYLRQSSAFGSALVSTGNVNATAWNHLIISKDGGTKYLMLNNGTLDSTGSTKMPGTLTLIYGNSDIGGGFALDGTYDEISIWNRSLNETEMRELYEVQFVDGLQYPYFIPAVFNESTETVSRFQQTSNVSIAGGGFQTIYSTTFPVETNNTPFYISNVVEITKSGGGSAVSECNILLNGTAIANRNKTIDSGDFGNIYIVTVNTTLDVGNHTMGLECQRLSGGGTLTYSNGNILGHQMVSEDGTFVNFRYDEFNFSVIPTNLTLLDSFNFTVSNRSTSGNQSRNVVVDWSAQYDWNDTGEISTQIRINGTQCSNYTANGTAGLMRSLGGTCGIEGFNANDTVLIEIYGRDTGGVAIMSLFTKQIIVDEVESVNTINQNIPILTTNLTLVGAGINISNSDHAVIDFLGSAGLAIKSNNGTAVFRGQVAVTGDVNESGPIFRLTVDENGAFMVIQNLLENFPVGDYSVDLFAACSTANCTITAVDSVTYATNVVTEILTGFNVSAFDAWDNSSIQNFSVQLSGGAIFTTTSGNVIVFSNLSEENLTITSNNGGGYFPVTVLNHNTSNGLNQTMNQSIITFNATEVVTGNTLSDVNFSINGTQLTVFNLKAGSYNVTATKSLYFNLTQEITVTPLQNGTIILTDMFNLLVNITVNNIINSSSINNFSGNVSLLPSFTLVTNFNTITGLAQVGLLQNRSYNFQLDPVQGLAITETSINVTPTNTTAFHLNVTFNLFTNNSISFSIFDLATSALFIGLVNVELEGSTITVFGNTSNGTLYLDNLNDDTYKVTFTSNRTDPTILFVTVVNSSHQFVTVFLDTENTVKDFLVQDNLGVFQPNVILTFLRLVNGSSVVVGQTQTDFSGRAGIFLNASITYQFFATKTGFVTFFGNVTPTEPEYTVIIFRDTAGIPTSIFDSLTWSTPFTYTVGSSQALAELIINSADGSLQFYGLNSTYLSVNYSNIESSTPAGSILNLNITNIDASLDSLLTVTYFFKLVGQDVQVWNATYYLDVVNASNSSITGGLFADLAALDNTNAIKGLVGFVIIFLLVLIFGALGRDVTPTAVGALIGLGINWFYTLLPRELLVISMGVLVIILIADNVGGGR